MTLFVWRMSSAYGKYSEFTALKAFISLNLPRWFDEKVSSLDLSAPLSILPELSVEETIGIMNAEGYDQLPVIDATG